jgi:hypothetical protein
MLRLEVGLVMLVASACVLAAVLVAIRRASKGEAWEHGRHCADDVYDPACRFCQQDTPRGRRLRGGA